MGVTTTVFFLVYGAGLAFCAWRVTRLESWARAPLVLAQLIQLGVAWSFRGGSSTPVAVGLALVAVLVIAGIFHPASLDALREPGPTSGPLDRRAQSARLLASDSRSRESVRASSRETCIWEMPISAAICDWVIPRKKRSVRMCFSRGSSASSSGLIVSRFSTCYRASSSSPITSIMLSALSSLESGASRESVE